jgi:hypothetical protein
MIPDAARRRNREPVEFSVAAHREGLAYGPPMAITMARVWTLLCGGILIGMGVLLHAQVWSMHYLREEVRGTFFLWRAIGQLTFVFQDDATQAALWAHECPAEVLDESEHAATAMLILGSLCAIGSALLRAPKR